MHGVPPHVSHRDLPLLRDLADDLDELLAALFGRLWHRQPDQLPVVRRRQAEVGLLNRFFDPLDRGGIERLDREHPRLWDVDRRKLLERRRRPVIVDRDAVEQRGRRAAGTHGVELGACVLDARVHPLACVLDQLVDGRHQLSSSAGVEMSVPTCSPATTRRMLPSASANTWIGRLLSMHSESAVVSITFSPRSIAWRWVSSGRNSAPGSSRGSPAYTPSVPCFAIRIASALIS